MKIAKIAYLGILLAGFILAPFVLAQIAQTYQNTFDNEKRVNTQPNQQNKLQNDPNEYDHIRNQIWALSNARDLDGLQTLQQEIENTWGKTQLINIFKANMYAGLMFTICGSYASQDWGNEKNNNEAKELTRKCVKKSLQSRDKILVWQEIDLVVLLRPSHEYINKLLSQEQWEGERREATELWLHALERLENEIDKNYDIEANRPKKISNLTPQERAKSEKYTEQYRLRQVKTFFLKQVEDFLVGTYTLTPYNTPELEGFLNKYVKDVGMRKSILAEVEQKILENQREKQNQ
jgi:hypothetical protein